MNAPMSLAQRQAFLDARRQGIGGSDIAVILGLSPYKTPFQLWQEKTGRLEENFDPEQLERMHWGNVLEDVVAREYAQRSGCKVQRINHQLRHPQWPLMVGNLDRVRVEDGSRARWDDKTGRVLGADAVLECKTANAFAAKDADNWGEPGTDQVPQHYWMQVQHYLGLTGLERGDLAVLFGGQQFRTYTIEADRALHQDIFAHASDWWQRHVVADVPPDPSTEAEARLAWKAHRPDTAVVAAWDTFQAVQQLREVKEQLKALEEQEQALRDAICCAMGDAEALTYQGQKLATWKASKPSSKTNWQAIAVQLGYSQELFDCNTTVTAGVRVLRLITPKE